MIGRAIRTALAAPLLAPWLAPLLAPLLAASMVSSPAQAQDPRLVERLYDPMEVVVVQGKVNVQSTIRFGDDEAIENVAVGDSLQWQVTPNRRANLLFVKPLAPRAATNMTVVTNRHTYLFDLVANPAHRNPLYILSFTYPADPEEERAAELAEAALAQERANAIELAAANDVLAVLDPEAVNFNWSGQGNVMLLPDRIYDNGDATFLSWPAGRAVPAILVKDREGMEGPVNFAVRNEMVVLDLVPREIILRSGDDEARLVNDGASVPAQGA